jgi:hypothetical protein
MSAKVTWWDSPDEDQPPEVEKTTSTHVDLSAQGRKKAAEAGCPASADEASVSPEGEGLPIGVCPDACLIAKPPIEPCIFPYLMPLAAPTVVRLPPNMLRDLRVLPMVLASTAASRGILELFGQGVGKPVTVLMGPSKHAAEDYYALGQIHDHMLTQHKEPDAPLQPVRLLHPVAGGPRLDDEVGRRALQDEIPTGGILIIYDLAGWSSNDKAAMSSENCSEVMDWLVHLCAQGHTPVVFEPSALGDDGLFNLVDPDDILEIDHDPVAQHDSGGGCFIRRERRGIFDGLPLRWNFWYHVLETKLNWGMEVRDAIDEDSMSEHARKVLLREIQVSKGIKRGAAQNKLADQLNVSASTICRDVKKLKNEGRIP